MIFKQVSSNYQIFENIKKYGITKYKFVDKSSGDYETQMYFKEFNEDKQCYSFTVNGEIYNIPSEEINKYCPCGILKVYEPFIEHGDFIAVKKRDKIDYVRISTLEEYFYYKNSVMWRPLSIPELEGCKKGWSISTTKVNNLGEIKALKEYTENMPSETPVEFKFNDKIYKVCSVKITNDKIKFQLYEDIQ